MNINVVFVSDIKDGDFNRITDLLGLVALDAIFIMNVEVPDYEDHETMCEIIESEFAKRYPGKCYTSYTVNMPRVA